MKINCLSTPPTAQGCLYVCPKSRVIEVNTKRLLCQSLRYFSSSQTEQFEDAGNYFDEN